MESIILTYPLKLTTKLLCCCSLHERCPVCTGYPAMLPLLNAEALRRVVLASHVLTCRFQIAEFYRVPSVCNGTLRRCLSMRYAPPGRDGHFVYDGKSIPILAVYLQEDFSGSPPAYGIPLLCIEAATTDSAFANGLTAELLASGVVDGPCRLTLRDEKRNITLMGTDAAYLRSLQAPGIYENEQYFDIALLPVEVEPNLCLVHIDPATAARVLAGGAL